MIEFDYLLQPFIECRKTGRRVITNNVELEGFNKMIYFDDIHANILKCY
jgi:hypothetical protein